MDSTPLRTVPSLQAALANLFCYLISSMDDCSVYVAQRSTLYLGTIHDGAVRVSHQLYDGVQLFAIRSIVLFLVAHILSGESIWLGDCRPAYDLAIPLSTPQLPEWSPHSHLGLFPEPIRRLVSRGANQPGEERRHQLSSRYGTILRVTRERLEWYSVVLIEVMFRSEKHRSQQRDFREEADQGARSSLAIWRKWKFGEDAERKLRHEVALQAHDVCSGFDDSSSGHQTWYATDDVTLYNISVFVYYLSFLINSVI